VAACILADLDGRGWLGRTVAGTARWLGVEVACVQRVLSAIRAVAGPAVAAEGLREALLLQLAATPGNAPPLLPALIGSHLEDIAAQRWDAIARTLGVPEKDVVEAVEYLRRELRPGLISPSGEMPRAPVDVVIEADQQGSLRVTLTASSAPEVDPGYARLACEPVGLTQTQAALVRAQVAGARQFIEALHRRDRTLLRIAELMVWCQQRFVRDGAAHHQPLTRGDIAGQLGLHASTVSRAIAGKTARLPDGRSIALAAFFGSAVGTREILARLIVDVAPASDARLATLLAEQGVCVSRRTVAKYRAQLCRTGFRH
jgi:RNA polymerase sigma-54 factor